MTAQLKLTLFGKPQVTLGDTVVTDFVSSKAEALLFYLAATGRPHSRETLADLLWSEMPNSRAKKNLRDALSNLRKLVGDHLQIERQSVAFDRTSSYWLDIEIFHHTIETNKVPQDLTKLRQVIDLYRGEFLEGFYVRDGLPFEEWVLVQREWLRGMALEGVQLLAQGYDHQGDDSLALEYTRRLLALDPWQESAHRQLMILLARTGQRSAALEQYEICRRTLNEALGVEPMAETQTLYERLKTPWQPPPHNLPPQPSSFVGRLTELRQITVALNDPNCRLLTLVGPGGMGKTRLALQVATEYLKQEAAAYSIFFAGGIYFIPLVSISSAKFLVTALGMALNVSFQGAKDATKQVLSYLYQLKKPVLLILDNFEQLLPTVDTEDTFTSLTLLLDILQQAPHIKLLITSRERLNLREEWVIEIAGLTYPDKAWRTEVSERRLEVNQYEIQELTLSDETKIEGDSNRQLPISNWQKYSAVTLFTQYARQAGVDFSLSEVDVLAAVRICQLVEGMPLGLELAAGWLRVISCREIAEEIQRNLDFLTSSLHNVPQRHRSLRAVFEHSWQLLSPTEQIVLGKLSIFQGGFRREAAERLVAATLPILSSLADKSFLRRSASGRYDIHELLRQYAAEKLTKLDTNPTGGDSLRQMWLSTSLQIRQQHSDYYLNFVSDHATTLQGPTPQHAVTEIRQELNNIRQAWQWGTVNAHLDKLKQSARGLAIFYDLSGLYQEGEAAFALAAHHVRILSGTRANPALRQQTCRVLGQILLAQASMLNRLGDFNQVIQITQAAIGLTEIIQAPDLKAMAHYQWGYAFSSQGAYNTAQTHLEQALELARLTHLFDLEAQILRQLGVGQVSQGYYPEARTTFQQALQSFKTIGDRRGESFTLNNLGIIAEEQGNYQEARSFYESAQQGFQAIEDLWGGNMIHNNLGVVAYDEGRYNEAQMLYEQGLHICRHILSHPYQQGILLENMGHVNRDQGNYTQAQSYYEQSLEIRQELGALLGESYTRAGMALLWHHQGDHESARAYSQQAEGIAAQIGARSPQAIALTHLGRALTALGQVETAIDAYQQAIAVRRALSQERRLLNSLAGLTQAYLRQGNLAQAQRQAKEILPRLDDLAGTIEPFYIRLTCYQVLRASHDPRAISILQEAYTRLQAQAASIPQEQLRRSFLENIPAHRHIIALASENQLC